MPKVSILPITALASIDEPGFNLVLVGEGADLLVYNVSDRCFGRLICRETILESQSIHGVFVASTETSVGGLRCLIVSFGGQQIAWSKLTIACAKDTSVSCSMALEGATQLEDWILLGRPGFRGSPTATFLTSYNSLFRVSFDCQLREADVAIISNVLPTFLYCADFIQKTHRTYIIASGTAFGEILTWKCHYDDTFHTWTTLPWKEFHGHLGSIFGLSISETYDVSHRPRTILASCSDDRSIRTWDLSTIEHKTKFDQQITKVVDKVSSVFTASKQELSMTWAHTSRVWDVHTIVRTGENGPELLVLSVGEDGYVKIWLAEFDDRSSLRDDTKHVLRDVYCDRLHTGKNIWASSYHLEGQRIKFYSGGADGQVASRHLLLKPSHGCGRSEQSDPISYMAIQHLGGILNGKSKAVNLKSYLVIGCSQLLASTNTGSLLHGLCSGSDISWTTISHGIGFKPLLLVSLSTSHHAFWARSSPNTLFAMDLTTHQEFEICTLRERKILTIHVAWPGSNLGGSQQEYCLAVSYFGSPDLEIIWINNIGTNTDIKKSTVILPDTFQVTSCCYDPQQKSLLCGSRAGAVAIYDDFSSYRDQAEPNGCRRHVHGEDTVTSIHVFPKNSCSNEFQPVFYLTTGRDGHFCILAVQRSISDDKARPVKIRVLHQAAPPIGQFIEGAYVSQQEDGKVQILLYGFHSKHFIAWNETAQTEAMKVECGGAHRDWSYHIDSSFQSGGTFAYTKGKTFMLHKQQQSDHNLIKGGGHGREIKALAKHKLQSSWLIATGSEDTDIRLFEYDRKAIKNISVLRKHTTGLQNLNFSPDGRYLISTAGMEELFAWRLTPIPAFGLGVVCVASLTRVDSQSDARIMAFDMEAVASHGKYVSYRIVAAFSNGKVKHIEFSDDGDTASFTILSQVDFGEICLTQVMILNPLIDNEFYTDSSKSLTQALIGATNGYINKITFSGSEHSPHRILENPVTYPASSAGAQKSQNNIVSPNSHKIHQNNISTLAYQPLTPTHTLLITGGDDNALAVTVLDTRDSQLLSSQNTTTDSVGSPLFRSLLIPKAHSAALTALTTVEIPATFPNQISSSDSTSLPPNQSTSPYTSKSFIIITASNDQVITIWRATINITGLQIPPTPITASKSSSASDPYLDAIRIDHLEDRYTNVADLSQMVLLDTEIRTRTPQIPSVMDHVSQTASHLRSCSPCPCVGDGSNAEVEEPDKVKTGRGGDGGEGGSHDVDSSKYMHIQVLVAGVGMETVEIEIPLEIAM